MHPACQLCRGACCESIVLHDLPPGDTSRWLALHGRVLPSGSVEFPAPCRELDTCGLCRIHATRPEPCRTYAVGGVDCRATIIRRRPAHSAEILAALPPVD